MHFIYSFQINLWLSWSPDIFLISNISQDYLSLSDNPVYVSETAEYHHEIREIVSETFSTTLQKVTKSKRCLKKFDLKLI
jgi:hypothetical protein